MRTVVYLCLSLSLCLMTSCGLGEQTGVAIPDYRTTTREFSVMSYNLKLYSFQDRDGGGQNDDPKPQEESDAVIALIISEKPDVLAIQEIGSPPVLESFCQELAKAGLSYEHQEYQRRGRHENNMAVLSRFPIVSRQSHMDDTYSIGEAKVHVARGFLDVDIEVHENYRFRLLIAHLKSKVFSPMGQTEMRRNEARLLNKHVRKALSEDPDMNLLVAGDLNDTYQSAALREVMGKRTRLLFDLRPIDYVGDAWTHFTRKSDRYSRIDYMLANTGMVGECVRSKTHVVRDPRTEIASDHRPIVAVFRAEDSVPEP